MNMDYYLLERDGEYQIISVPAGLDPLYGRGSWNIASGPHASRETVEKALEWIAK